VDRVRRALRLLPGFGREARGGALKRIATIALPPHAGAGGFDHAAVAAGAGRLYVAHTANGAVDVIDTRAAQHVASLDGLTGVAGALVCEEQGLVFTSNRGEDTVAIVDKDTVHKVPVGRRPNGLAYDPGHRLLLAANVGEPPSVSFVSVDQRREIARVPMPGRTRWAVFDPPTTCFLVNIADPARIVLLESDHPDRVAGTIEIPVRGPHGLDADLARRRLYCACDAGVLVVLDLDSGAVRAERPLSGAPDVVFLDPALRRLYIAIGDPGVIDVFRVDSDTLVETVVTEKGAHTIALDPSSHLVYSFLPQAHAAAVFQASSF
jgi:DNA-binding beta-propeller fold protein YncE